MGFSARVYWLIWRILKKLPSPWLPRVACLLHFKIPVTPSILAGTLLMMASGMLKVLGKELLNTDEFKQEFKPLSEKETFDLLGEILRAYYCLAVAVLGEDEFALDLAEYNLYTASTYERLKELVDEKAPQALSKKTMDEATTFYLHDNPSLAEYGQSMREYCLGNELENAKKPDPRVWFYQFMVKLKIRVAAALGVQSQHLLQSLTLTTTLSSMLLANADLLRQWRPVIWDPTESRTR